MISQVLDNFFGHIGIRLCLTIVSCSHQSNDLNEFDNIKNFEK